MKNGDLVDQDNICLVLWKGSPKCLNRTGINLQHTSVPVTMVTVLMCPYLLYTVTVI